MFLELLKLLRMVIPGKDFLNLFWKFVEGHALIRTISFLFYLARIATNEEYVTCLIFAVNMLIALFFRTEMAMRNYFITDSLPHSLIKHKVFSLKAVW